MIVSTGASHERELAFCNSFQEYALLECVAAYPAVPWDYNSVAISKFAGTFGVSDHTVDGTASLAAIWCGASIFERHFDGLGGDPTPDSPVSATQHQMKDYVDAIRALYHRRDGVKRPRQSEDDMLLRHRRRIIATRDIAAGEKLVRNENYGIYRSKVEDRNAAAPEMVALFDGHVAKRDIKRGDGLWFTDIG